MFAPTNPEHERIRAQHVLSSFTDQRKAAELFKGNSQDAPVRDQVEAPAPKAIANRNNGQSVNWVFRALKLSRS